MTEIKFNQKDIHHHKEASSLFLVREKLLPSDLTTPNMHTEKGHDNNKNNKDRHRREQNNKFLLSVPYHDPKSKAGPLTSICRLFNMFIINRKKEKKKRRTLSTNRAIGRSNESKIFQTQKKKNLTLVTEKHASPTSRPVKQRSTEAGVNNTANLSS